MSNPLSTAQFAKKPNPKMPLVTVRLSRIGSTQNYLNHAKVMDIAARGASDGTPPLIARLGKDYKVLDGHHRIGAAWENGETKIKARLVK